MMLAVASTTTETIEAPGFRQLKAGFSGRLSSVFGLHPTNIEE